MAEEHQFAKSHIESDFIEESGLPTQAEKEKDMLAKFAWDNAEEDVADDFQPEFESVSRISECVLAVADHVLKNLTTDQATFGEDETALKMYVPIDASMHSLLEDRYSSQWTEESRLVVFECVRGMFRLYWDESARLSIEVQLDEMFPFQGKKRHSIDSIELWDEPVPSEDGTNYGVEILASYVAKAG